MAWEKCKLKMNNIINFHRPIRASRRFHSVYSGETIKRHSSKQFENITSSVREKKEQEIITRKTAMKA